MTWRLHTQEQRYYTLPDLTATTLGAPIEVAVDAWELSLDAGATWLASQPHPNQPNAPCWLLRGPDYPGAGDTPSPGGTLVAHSARPLVRLRDAPETAIATAPWIQLVR